MPMGIREWSFSHRFFKGSEASGVTSKGRGGLVSFAILGLRGERAPENVLFLAVMSHSD